jgi:hypothetical protein
MSDRPWQLLTPEPRYISACLRMCFYFVVRYLIADAEAVLCCVMLNTVPKSVDIQRTLAVVLRKGHSWFVQVT